MIGHPRFDTQSRLVFVSWLPFSASHARRDGDYGRLFHALRPAASFMPAGLSRRIRRPLPRQTDRSPRLFPSLIGLPGQRLLSSFPPHGRNGPRPGRRTQGWGRLGL